MTVKIVRGGGGRCTFVVPGQATTRKVLHKKQNRRRRKKLDPSVVCDVRHGELNRSFALDLAQQRRTSVRRAGD